ncbi:MAG TPA: DUF3987 domain-containing protein, partial [Rubrobacteraceae bacterium]|nr:DUF3987 domain-containing protein [Rubrobacteraceae bacterium]
ELESPGFPQRLRPAWGKLEAYLARFALILAMTRITELEEKGRGPTEEVTLEDMEGAAMLLAYFKNHARRVFTGLYGDNAADKLAADLRDFLISCGGQWEGSASELFEAFESEHKPDRDKDLGKMVRAITKRSPLLRLEDLPRKTTLRRFRLTLENVGSVGSVGSDDAASEASTDAEDAEADEPDAGDANTPHEPADPLAEFLDKPPMELTVRYGEYVRHKKPEKLLKQMVTYVANEVYGSAHRWPDADEAVREWAARVGARA